MQKLLWSPWVVAGHIQAEEDRTSIHEKEIDDGRLAHMSDERFDHEWYGMDDYDKGQYLDHLLKSRNFWRRITIMLLISLLILMSFAK